MGSCQTYQDLPKDLVIDKDYEFFLQKESILVKGCLDLAIFQTFQAKPTLKCDGLYKIHPKVSDNFLHIGGKTPMTFVFQGPQRPSAMQWSQELMLGRFEMADLPLNFTSLLEAETNTVWSTKSSPHIANPFSNYIGANVMIKHWSI